MYDGGVGCRILAALGGVFPSPPPTAVATEIQQIFSDGFSFPTPCFLFLRYGAIAMRLGTHKFFGLKLLEEDRALLLGEFGSVGIGLDPVVVYKPRNFWGVPLTPPKKGDAFPTPEEGNVPINTSWYGMFLGISRVLGELWTAGRYPSADFRPIRKADCVSRKSPLQNT
ncbi:hypothetical protein TNCV_531011 [Trichonephila clavipes]|nr:hypothetical protein TNCV_531011 [Trichonephila clavipes]